MSKRRSSLRWTWTGLSWDMQCLEDETVDWKGSVRQYTIGEYMLPILLALVCTAFVSRARALKEKGGNGAESFHLAWLLIAQKRDDS